MKNSISKDVSFIYLRRIIDNVPHYIFWKNKECVFLGCNKAFADSAGLNSPEDIVGKTDFDLPWSQFAESYRNDDLLVMETATAKLNIEEPQITFGGKTATLLTSKVPLFDNGKVIGVIGVYSDITERKNMELMLEKALKSAEIANQLKSDFIVNMSHDIRTPITGMLGLIDSLRESVKNDATQRDLTLLMHSTQELLNLLNEVISVLRLEFGSAEETLEAFSLKDLLRHNVTLVQPAIQHKKLILNTSMSPNIPNELYGNRVYLDRILLNIVGNAIKFTDQGRIDIGFDFEIKSKDSIVLILQVKDTGIGIPADKISVILDRYARLTPSYRGKYKGSGIGLYFVKKYIEEMSGEIDIQSEVGRGSCFTIRVPFELAQNKPGEVYNYRLNELAEDVEIRKKLILDQKAFPVKTQARVLIVEDNALAARMAQQTLKKLNYASDVAETADLALAAARSKQYCLILMDIGLPDQDGFSLSRKIRTLPNCQTVPIIALTGHMSFEKKEACFGAEMQDMVTKPISLAVAKTLLEKWVLKEKGEAELAETVHSSDDLAMFDLKEGAELSIGCESSAKELVKLLIDSLPDVLQSIEYLHGKKDYVEMANEVHKLYGGLCYVGVPKLREIARRLNDKLEDDFDRNEVDQLILQLTQEIRNIIANAGQMR